MSNPLPRFKKKTTAFKQSNYLQNSTSLIHTQRRKGALIHNGAIQTSQVSVLFHFQVLLLYATCSTRR